MAFKEAVPKPAAAIILVKNGNVFLAQRNPALKFLGGWHAFPGGKVDAADRMITVRNCNDEVLEKYIVAAVRETFEEVGVLLVRGADKITKGQRASLHDDLMSGRFSFGEILESWGLWIDASDFRYTGFWTTPKFSPVRFETHFFVASCPRRQEPQVFGEFSKGEFLAPDKALAKWRGGEILISPPVLISLETLAKNAVEKSIAPDAASDEFLENNTIENSFVTELLEKSRRCNGEILHIKFNEFVTVFPVRSDTLPPATHTNCFIVGERKFAVIDPGSPFAEEQNALHEYIDSLIASGGEISAIILTHLHQDHTAGANALQKFLREKFDLKIPIAAHIVTAESLCGEINVERLIGDSETFTLETGSGERFDFTALHTSGHARGHLCFYFEKIGFLLSGDNVVGAGSVLIAAPEGEMIAYLNSLERMKNLPNLKFLCGSHGAAMFGAPAKIESYIRHRLDREKSILKALETGAKTTREIVEKVYADVAPELWSLAEKSVEAHLKKIAAEKGSMTNFNYK